MSAAASSSSRAPLPARIELPDDTFKSLAALLSSPAESASSHLDLIPANNLSSSITHYLATLPTEDSASFAKLLTTSNVFWTVSATLQRSKLLYEATARSVLTRIHVILNERRGSLGWQSRRALLSWIRAISDAIHLDAASLPSSCRKVPISTFSINTGLVAGLQAFQAQQTQNQSRSLKIQYAIDRAEDEWCIALAECIDALIPDRTMSGSTLHLAAQVAPYIPSKKLSALPNEPLIEVLADALLGTFEGSSLLDSIREDVTQSDQGLLMLQQNTSTASKASALASHPLYAVMGPLSRMMSLVLSNSIRTMSPLVIQDMLIIRIVTRMQSLADQWQSQWLSCRLSGVKEEEINPSSQSQTTQLWNIFKTLLFSFTMIFDAVMEAIVDVCPSPTLTLPANADLETPSRWTPSTTSNIPPVYLNMTSRILRTYSHLSWITATFGSSSFDAYRRVFYEALEVLTRDSQACVNLIETISPSLIDSNLQANAGRRAATTYYFDVIEQSMTVLPDEMIAQEVLPLAKAYMEHATYQDAFESAHSVILSIFSTRRKVLLELTAYYVDLLFKLYPTRLNDEQLMHAYSTIIDATSDKSDTVTWYALEVLWKQMDNERMKKYSTNEKVDTSNSEDNRRQLSQIYVAQLANVNLVLLRSMLSKVKYLILQEERDSVERIALCEKTFDCLASLDASTREEGLRWWLQERKQFGI